MRLSSVNVFYIVLPPRFLSAVALEKVWRTTERNLLRSGGPLKVEYKTKLPITIYIK